MLNRHVASIIYDNFEFPPTPGQESAIERLSSWITNPDYENIFILNGYAGTGKTTLIASFVTALKEIKINPVLLAPTGRAAKVVGRHTKEQSYTIHKKIYRQKSLTDMDSGFSLDYNKEHDTCFIVDEGSMLSDRGFDGDMFGSGSLLDDLIKYVRSGTRCRLMIVGDNAQLPPVGHDRSPALDREYMRRFGEVDYASLDDVVRQDIDSGILFNSTLVRCMLESGIYEPPKFDISYPDFQPLGGYDLMEKIEDCYSKYGKDETIIITRSNRQAGRFNQGVRRHVLYSEGEIEAGDMLMIVKNNYYYNSKEKDVRMEFIANGDTAQLSRLRNFEEQYGFKFATAELQFPDYDNTEVEATVMLDTLYSDAPALSREQSSELFYAVAEDYAEEQKKRERYRKVIADPYFNALQIKFAYAITCHKAQGGQWSAVFVDRMLFGDEPMSLDLMRWLYTALTRATEQVYLVNFDQRFFEQELDEF